MGVETFFEQSGESLQYGLYFGLLLALGGLEAAAPRRPQSTQRRRRWPTNFELTGLNILVLGALPVTGIGVAAIAQEHGLGLLQILTLPAWAALSITLLSRSLASYATHVAMHVYPVLWQVHQVHHTDRAVDVSTTVRFHPIEFLVQLVPNVLLILALGLPAWSLAVYELLDTGMNVFIHANVRLPSSLERVLRLVLATPDLHRVHHSVEVVETNSNYGVVFSGWDRLFGTYRAEPALGHQGMMLGTGEGQGERIHSLASLLLLPFQAEARQRAAAS